MNEWTNLSNTLILDANSMYKLIGKYVIKIVYIYDQAFKVPAHAKKIFGVQRGIFSKPLK